MKSLKNLNLGKKLGKTSWGGASATLRKMPMWQRIVSAIVAFLLVFLLWPADAAKTITAWANDTEAAATTEEGVADPDPESPDPGGGGEVDPEVDPVPDPEPEPEADPTDDPQEEAGEADVNSEDSENAEFDENAIYLDSNAPVNGVQESCGPFEWNFSAYQNNNRSFSTVNTQAAIQWYNYLDTNKCGTLQFVSPFNSNNDKLDGGASSVTENGFVMNAYHRLKGSTNKNTDGQIFSNYIIFTPSTNLNSITISAAAISTKIKDRLVFDDDEYYPWFYIMEVDDPSATHYSTDNLPKYSQALTSTSWTEIKWDNGGKGLSQGKSYLIFFKPNTEDSYYADYGGGKINNIKVDPLKDDLTIKTTGNADDTLTFSLYDYQDSSSITGFHLAKEISFETWKNEDEHSQVVNDLNVMTYPYWTLKSQKTGLMTFGTMLEISFGDENTLSTQINYPKIKGIIHNSDFSHTITTISVRYDMTNGDKDEYSIPVEIASGEEINFEYPVIMCSGVITLWASQFNPPTKLEKYCEVNFEESTQHQQIINIGTFYAGEAKQRTNYDLEFYAREFGSTSVTSAKDYIDAYTLIESTSGGYYQKKLDIPDGEKVSLEQNTRIRILSKPYGLCFKDVTVPTAAEYVNLNNYVIEKALVFELQIPKYTWNDLNETNEVKHYSCTAECYVYDWVEKIEKTITSTVTTKSVSGDGTISRDVITRATTTSEGFENLVAKFTATEVFVNQSRENVEIPMVVEAHEHGGILYNKKLTAPDGKLPTTAGNYYLDGDVQVTAVATIPKNTTINICLNGYAIYYTNKLFDEFLTEENADNSKTFYINQGTLNICDCHKGDEACRHYFNATSSGQWKWIKSGAHGNVYVDGGIITGAEKSAIHNEGTLTCTDVNFIGNANNYNDNNNFGDGCGGGAIRSGTTSNSYSPKLTLNGCNFKGNISQGAGGAVLVGVSNETCNAGQAWINNCYFSNNALIGETSSTSGYYHPWGGGALATFSLSSSNPVIYIDGSEFYENTSKFRAGAIMLFHGTKCYMSNTTVQHNKSGLYYETGKSTSYNYAGGVCVYTGYGDQNKNNTYLYLSGKIICTENYSETKENGNIVTYEDNLGLQIQAKQVRGYIYLEQGKLLDPSSVIGVNYIDNHNLDISQGYGASYVPQSERKDPIVKYFILDEVADRLSYALLIDMSSYELWIVSHTHKLSYTNYKSREVYPSNSGFTDEPQEDMLSVKCSEGTSEVSGHTFSKCKYAQNECTLWIHSEGFKGLVYKNEFIPYDGKPHGVVVDFKNEFEGIIGQKPVDYNAVTNPDGIIYTNILTGDIYNEAPTQPGFYMAIIRYYDVKIQSGKVVVDKGNTHYARSDYYEIRGPELTVNVGEVTKEFDGTNEAIITDCWIGDEGKIVEGDDVRVVLSGWDDDHKVYTDEGKIYTGKYNIKSYNKDAFVLEGKDAYKYSIGKVAGIINITPAQFYIYGQRDFALFEGNEQIDMKSIMNFSENISNYVSPDNKRAIDLLDIEFECPSPEPQYQYNDVGTLTEDKINHTQIYQRKTDGEILALEESGHTLFRDDRYGEKAYADARFHIKDAGDVYINDDDNPEFVKGPTQATVATSGFLVLDSTKSFNCSFTVNNPEKGKVVDFYGQDLSSMSFWTVDGNEQIKAEYNPDNSTLEISEQDGTLDRVLYKINNPSKDYYQQWTFKVAAGPETPIPTKALGSEPLKITQAGTFTCYFGEIPIPKIGWEFIPITPEDETIAYEGQEIDFNLRVYNASQNCDLEYPSGHIEEDYSDEQWEIIDTKGGGTYAPNETICTINVKFDTRSYNFKHGEAKFINDFAARIPQGYYEYSYNEVFDTSFEKEYTTAEINTSLEVSVVPDLTYVKITDSTIIHYTLSVTNTGNMVLENGMWSSQLLGINENIPNKLAPGQTKSVTNVELKNINESMITNNEIVCDVFVRFNPSYDDTKVVDGSASAATIVEKEKVPVPTRKTNLVYDGTQQVGVVNPYSYGLDADANLSNTDAGTYTVWFTLKPWYAWEDTSITTASVPVTYTISPATLTAKFSSVEFTSEYNGQVYSGDINNYITGYYGDDPHITDATFTTNGVNAKTYTYSNSELDINYTEVPNYTLVVDPNSNATISPKRFDVATIGIDTTDKIYNGNTQSTNIAVWDITLGENPTLLTTDSYDVKAGASGDNVGEYTLEIWGKGNYAQTKLTKTWNITKSSITVVLTGNNVSKVYSGDPQSVVGATVAFTSNPQSIPEAKIGSILMNGAIVDPSTITATGTDVGSYWMFEGKTFSLTEDSQKNIDATFNTNAGYLTITKKSIKDADVVVNGTKSLPFNGAEQDCGITVTYKGKTLILGTDYSVVDNKFKNVGEYFAKITAMGNNFTGSKNFYWEITRIMMPITHEPFTKEYDATFLTDEFNFKPFGTDSIDELRVTVQTSSDTVGQYSGGAVFGEPNLIVNVSPANETTDLDNYILAWATLSASISKKALRVVPQSRSFEYDGFEHSLVSNEVKYLKPGSTEDGLLTNHYVDVNAGDVTWSDNNKATDYTPEPKVVKVTKIKITSATIYEEGKKDVTSNYEIDYETPANLEITKLKMTIDVVGLNAGLDDSERIFYDGEEHSITGYKAAEKRTGTGATQTGKFDISKLTPASDNCSVSATTPGEYKLQYKGKDLTAADFTYTDSNIAATINYDPGVLKISKNVVTITVNESMNQDGNKFVHKIITDKTSPVCEVEGLAPGEGFSTTEDSTLTTNDVVEGCYDKEGSTGFTFTADLKWENPDFASHYEISYFVKLTIKTQLVITVTGHRSNDSNIKYYNGELQEISGYEVSGSKSTFDESKFHMKKASEGKDYVSGINAGRYDMGLTANDFYYDDPSELNPEIIVVDGYLIIKQKELEDSMLENVEPLEMEYNGQTQGPTFTVMNGGSVLLTGRDFYVDDGTGVDAGTYKAVIHGQGNYTGQIKPVQWKITKATVTFDIKGNSDVRQYNGQEHTVSGYTYTVDKLAPFINDEKLKLDSDKGTISKVAAGVYKMNLEAANFSYDDSNIIPQFTVTDGSLTIQKRNLKDVNVYLDPDTYIYDGAQHEPSVIIKDFGSDEPLPLKLFNISGQTIGKNAGTYTINVDAYTDDSNYDGVVELKWTIEKVYMEINISGTSKTEQYTGSKQSVDGFSAQKVSDTGFFDSKRISVIDSKPHAEGINAGLYYMHLIASDFDYNDDNQFVKFNIAHDGCLEITPININTFDVSVNPSHYVYNGEYQEPTVTAQSSVGMLTLDKDYVKEGAKAKNVGDYQLKVTGIGNYTGERTFDWIIVKADVDVLIQGNKVTADYDGNIKTASGYKITEQTTTGLINSGVVRVTPDSNSCVVTATNAGTYPMNLYDKQFRTDNTNVNFTYTIEDGLLTISAVDVSKCTFTSVNKVYNGKEQNAELNGVINGVNLTQGEDFTLSGAGTSGINAGPYEVIVTGKGNFTGTATVTWNITPAPVDVHINANSKTYTYDGTQHTVSGFTSSSDVDFFVPASISYEGSAPSATATNAGTTESFEYVVRRFKCADTNVTPTYKIDQAKAKLVINPAELTVSARGAKFYDNDFLSTNATIKGLLGTDAATATVSTTAKTPAIYNVYGDSFTSEITFISGIAENYYETYDVELNIYAQPPAESNTIVIYGPSAAYTYDGNEKTLSANPSTKEGFVFAGSFGGFDASKVNLTKNAQVKGTNVGSYKLGLTKDNFTYTDTTVENLKIVYYDGTLTITPKQITSEMIAEFAPTSFIYNTKEQGPTVTAIDGDNYLTSSDYEVENGTAVDAGVYNATIKGRGNYTGEVTGFGWVINKADVVVNIDSSYEYDGEIFRYTMGPNEMVGKYKDDDIECEFATSSSIPGVYTTNEGNVTYKYEGDNLDNYNIHTYVTLRIDKRVLNVTPTSKTYVYDGLEHKLLDSEINYDNLLSSHYVNNVNWQNNSLTNVGTNNNVAVGSLNIFKKTGEATEDDVTSYYAINYHPASLTVTPANIAIQVRGNSGSYAYDGQSHKVSGYDAWEVPFTTGAAITGTFDKNKLVALDECIAVGVDPGTYNMGQDEENFVYEDSNYNNIKISYEDGSLSITKNSFDSAVMDVRNLTYNGKDQQTSLVVNMYDDQGHWTSTLKEGVDYELANPETALKGKNAATYDVTIIGKGKYEGAEKTTSWVIKKADVELDITGLNATKEYNGKEQVFPGPGEKGFKAVETSATGLYKDVSQISVAAGHTIQAKGTELGSYSMGINVSWLVFNDQQNVNAHFTLVKDGSLTITEADISSAQATATSFVYNGAEQTTKITVKINDKELAYGVDYEIDENAVISATNVGRYQAKVKGIGNYKGVKNDIYWEISKADLTIKVTGNTLETEYTGYEQSVSGFKSEAVNGAVKLFDMNKVVLCSGKPALAKGTDKGVYTTDITYSSAVKDLAYNDANINATFIGDMATSGVITQVKLTINAKKLQINAMDVKSYDGQPLVHSITTKDVDGAVSGQIVSGTVTTTSSEAGTYTDTKLDLTIKVDGKPDEGNLFYMLFSNGDDPRANYDIENTSSLVITNDEQDYIIVKGNVESHEYNSDLQTLGANPYTVSTNIDDFDPSKLSFTGDWNVQGQTVGDYYSNITGFTYDGESSDNYTFTQAKLSITKRSITEASLGAFTNSFSYNAKGQQPDAASIVAKDFDGSITLLAGTDYVFKAPQIENSINPGTYIISLDADAVESSNYKGKLDVNYMIFKASRVVNITGNIGTSAYDGNSHNVTGYTFEEEKEASDPALINAAYVTPAFNDCVVSGTLIGNYPMGLNASEFEYVGPYKDFINVQFKIVQDGKLEITAGAGEASGWTVTLDQTEFTYNGKAQGPNVVSVVDANGNVIDPKFYDVTGNSQVNANVEGTYTLTVKAKGSYTGEKNVAWKINKASRVVEIYGEQSLENVYNGSMQYVYGFNAVEVTGEAESIVDPDQISPSKEEVYAGGKDAGTYKKNLAASTFSYGDSNNVNVEFQIKQDVILKISKCDINTVTASLSPEYKTYNHQVQSAPTETLKLNESIPLTRDTDYTIAGDMSGTNVGTYTLKIKAVNTSNFTGERSLTWNIVPAIVDIYINGTQINKVYDGQESIATGYTAELSSSAVLDSEIAFRNGDESVPSISGTNAGVYPYNLSPEYFTCLNSNVVATFHIQSDVKVTISRKNVADNDVVKSAQDFTYSGDTYTSAVTLEYNGMTLTEGAENDFVVTNNTGVNAGDYTAKVEGKGNYEGYADVEWVIHKLEATVTVNGAKASYEYDGYEHCAMGYTLSIESPRQEDANRIINPNLVTPGKGSFAVYGTDKDTYTMTLEQAYGSTISWSYDQGNNENVDLRFFTGSDLELTITDTDIRNWPVDIVYTDEFTYNGEVQSPATSLSVTLHKQGATISLTVDDYDLVGDVSATNVLENGNYSFSIVGKNNYTGQLDNNTWRITPFEININPPQKTQKFNGWDIYWVNDYTGVGEEMVRVSLRTMTNNNGVPSEGINAGTYFYPKDTESDNYIDLQVIMLSGAIRTNYNLNISHVLWEITQAQFSDVKVHGSDLTYNGFVQTEEIILDGVGGETLVAGRDFTITGNTGKDAKLYIATLTNINPNYTTGGVKEAGWSISRASLPKYTYSDSKQYDGKIWQGTNEYLTGINNEKFSISFATKFAKAVTYTEAFGITPPVIAEIEGSAKITNYNVDSYEKDISITINPKSIDPDVDDDIDIFVSNPDSLIYDSTDKKDAVKALIKVQDNEVDIAADNYEITFEDSDAINAGEYNFTVTAKANYTGSYTGTWSILPAPVTYNYVPEPHVYDGEQFKPSTTLTAFTLSGQIFGTDSFDLWCATLENEQPAVNVGEYNYPGQTGQKRALMGVGPTESSGSLLSNYTFNITAKLTINSADIFSLYKEEYVDSLEYNGADQMPEISVVLISDESVVLNPNEYTIVGEKHKNAGNDYGFYIQAKEGGNFTGTIGTATNPLTWKITPKNIPYVFRDNVAYTGNDYSKDVKLSNTDGLCLSDTVTVTFKTYLDDVETGNAGVYGFNAATTGTSLRAAYNDNNYVINFAGSKVTIKGKSIDPEINSSISVNYTKRLEYAATEIAPNDLVIKDGETVLTEGTDYKTDLATAKKLDVPESGGYTFTITGTGNYSGSFDNSWTIYPKTVEVPAREAASHVYDGQKVTEEYNIKNLLLESDDITLWFTTLGTNAGTYKYITTTGDQQLLLEKQRIAGSDNVLRDYELIIKGMTINITPRSISTDYTVNGVEDKEYNATEQTLDLTISDGTLPLTESDYKVVGVISAKDVQDPKVASGKYEFHIVADSPNFTGEIWNGSPNVPFKWAITPKAASYVFSDDDFTYNAKKYENYSLEINNTTATGVIDGDRIGLTVTSSGKDVGTYSFTITNDGTLSAKYSELTTLPRNYNISISGSVKIVPKTLNPDVPAFEYPEYNGEEQSPDIVVKDKDTGEVVPAGNIAWTGDTEATDVSDVDLEITGTINGGNYTGSTDPIPWNIRPKAITIKIAEEKIFDGQTIKVEGQWPGVKEESFEYAYETDDSAVGVYSVANGNVTGGFEPTDESTKLTNYAVTEDVVLTISGEPSPDVPEYVTAQTGDTSPVVGFAIMALTLIGAFLFLRRPKKVQGLHTR